ncbi:hypothetical protein CIB48_g9196 [Xylaria polymorpha]|nr:hypothetical protein CIB48_g9196 [Xylaria polymorpha]
MKGLQRHETDTTKNVLGPIPQDPGIRSRSRLMKAWYTAATSRVPSTNSSPRRPTTRVLLSGVLVDPGKFRVTSSSWTQLLTGKRRKTQIALAYAYGRCRDPTCSVFWVHADTETSFMKDYQSIARKLGVTTSLDGEDLLTAVRDRIEDIPNWVLVLDNADDLMLFGVARQRSSSSGSGLNLNDFVPRGRTGTVLWTSRDRQIAGSLVAARRAIHIVQMTSAEAETLLDRVRNEKTKEYEYNALRELLTELDYLPLAVSQAAAYMRRTSTSVRDYLSEIRRSKGRIPGRSEHDQHRREQISNNVLETWDISVQHLRKENELTYDVLHSLAFVDNLNIPFELIREAARLAQRRSTLPNQPNNSSKESDINKKCRKGRP